MSTATAGPAPRRQRRPLPLRAETRRQLRRRRTLVSFGFLVALPLILVGAFALGDDEGGGGNGRPSGFVDLAQTGSANFMVFTLFASTGFLLVVLAALFAGDSVPSEASWSTLRYLLAAPVPRRRLLTVKLVVGLLTILAALLVLVGWSLLVGGLAYGWSPFTDPVGRELGWSVLWPRIALIIAILFANLLFVASAAFLFGVITDAPLAAVGGAVMLTIVFAILDSITALGNLREGLPTHYQYSWAGLLDQAVVWGDIQRGLLWAVVYSAVLLAAAYVVFERKDVLS